jgi:hypothetical protein
MLRSASHGAVVGLFQVYGMGLSPMNGLTFSSPLSLWYGVWIHSFDHPGKSFPFQATARLLRSASHGAVAGLFQVLCPPRLDSTSLNAWAVGRFSFDSPDPSCTSLCPQALLVCFGQHLTVLLVVRFRCIGRVL